MRNRQLDFLCFLAKQAKVDVCNTVAKKAFELLYPIELKIKEVQQNVEKQAFQILYPLEMKQKQVCEQLAYESFKVLYPIEKTYKALTDKEKCITKLQEISFLMIYPVEKMLNTCKKHALAQYSIQKQRKERLQETFSYQKTVWKTRYKTQKMQRKIARIKKKSINFCTAKVPLQCNKMQMSIHEAHVWYLHTVRFRIKHHKLVRMYEDVLVVIRRSYDMIENRIVAYYTMLFGIFLRWVRGSSLHMMIQN